MFVDKLLTYIISLLPVAQGDVILSYLEENRKSVVFLIFGGESRILRLGAVVGCGKLLSEAKFGENETRTN
ncbi:hypothetical protein HOY82DRAFT_145342 [Tuber indicum]|nr:hypothetical protein HOY82DRAFT_145342 [Tuber indicum]